MEHMLNEDEERTDILENLIRELKEIAPVYLSLGNHEVIYPRYPPGIAKSCRQYHGSIPTLNHPLCARCWEKSLFWFK